MRPLHTDPHLRHPGSHFVHGSVDQGLQVHLAGVTGDLAVGLAHWYILWE